MGDFEEYENPWNAKNSEWNTNEYSRWLVANPNPSPQTSNSYKALIETDSKGWLNVKTSSGEIISIAKYTRVKNLKYNGDKTREEFTIIDWPYSNKKVSVSAISKTKSRFSSVQYSSPGLITFERDKNRLKYGSSSWIHTATDSGNPIPKGTYNLWLPDYYHSFGDSYLNLAKYSTVWFRIGAASSDRYLHVGNVSLGCVSVGEKSTGGTDADKREWDKIYDYLIKRRSGTKYVGKIKVI